MKALAFILLVTVHHAKLWNQPVGPGEWVCLVSSGDTVTDEACSQKAIRFASRAELDAFLTHNDVGPDAEVVEVKGGKTLSVTQSPVMRPAKPAQEVDHYKAEVR